MWVSRLCGLYGRQGLGARTMLASYGVHRMWFEFCDSIFSDSANLEGLSSVAEDSHQAVAEIGLAVC